MTEFVRKGKGVKMKKNVVLPADVSEEEYKIFKVAVEKKQKRLLKSIEKFTPHSRKWIIPFKWGIEDGMNVQSYYTDVPFRMESKGDTETTVATSGCAILIAKFLEICLRQRCGIERHYTIEELAELAVDNGYRGYREEEDHTWTPMGTKHVFFDRFIPSLYGFEVERAVSIESIFESLKECGLPVLLLSNTIYKEDPKNTDSHFVVVCGYDDQEQKFLLYDPEYPEQIEVPYSRVLPAIRNAWIVYE